MSNTERKLLVLGATGGIGSEICRRAAEEGWAVFGAGRNREALAALGDETGVATGTLAGPSFDAIEECVGAAAARLGGLGAIVNAIGSVFLKPAIVTTEDEFDQVVDANLRSAFAAVRAGGRALRGQGGSILLFSSAAATVGLHNHEAVAAAKGGVEGLVRAAAATLAREGIRVNAVAPGLVRTPATERITGNERAVASSEAMHALGRLGEPADVARLVVHLVDPGSAWITGQVFGVDGGLAHVRSRST